MGVNLDPWIRNPSDELAIDQGCAFDEAAGLLVCDFIERFCRQSKGRWAGRPLTLIDWQRDFLMRLFGWKRADGLRRFRRAYLEVAKKNGKSTLISGLGLYLLLADEEAAPEVYLNACDKEQASIIFEEQKRMVEASPSLNGRLQILNSASNKRIVYADNNGVIIANSSVAASKDGLNPSAIIFDELHRQPGRDLWDVFEYAASSREQPLTISITTAGESDEGIWHEQRHYSEQVNAGVIPDVEHLGVVYRALESDDLDDPATWRKANPSLGVTLREDDFRSKLEEARRVPVKLNNFKRLRLNIVAREAERFVDLTLWDACPDRRAIVELTGEPCWMGLDLSDTNDLTALAALYGDAESGFDVLMHFWLPEENIVSLEHRHGVPYRLWADQGHITLTPGNTVDYGFVRAEVVRLAALSSLHKLGADPYHAHKLAQDLVEDHGLPVEFVRQGFVTMNGPTKELNRLYRAGRLRHGADPILRWNASNAVVLVDEGNLIKLSKKKSKHKIDGLAAVVNALAVATSGAEGGSSVYEERGLLVL